MSSHHRLRNQIDRVFNHIAKKAGGEERPKKRRRVETPSEPQGGFVVEDAPGGSIPDKATRSDASESDERNGADTILLSLVPEALQLLDLPPDDPEVLSVFRNAASGWSNENQIPGGLGEGDVTRADFRAVCLVLLGSDNDEMDIEDPGSERLMNSPPGPSEESDAAEDVYREPSLTSPSEEEDNYQDSDFEDSQLRTQTKSRRKRTRKSSESDIDLTSRPITSRQKQVCLDAFQLFFPSAEPHNLPQQKIYLKDLIRAADSIRERIKSDDMLDMLKEFSSSIDKSMNLEDFQRMMLATKLA